MESLHTHRARVARSDPEHRQLPRGRNRVRSEGRAYPRNRDVPECRGRGVRPRGPAAPGLPCLARQHARARHEIIERLEIATVDTSTRTCRVRLPTRARDDPGRECAVHRTDAAGRAGPSSGGRGRRRCGRRTNPPADRGGPSPRAAEGARRGNVRRRSRRGTQGRCRPHTPRLHAAADRRRTRRRARYAPVGDARSGPAMSRGRRAASAREQRCERTTRRRRGLRIVVDADAQVCRVARQRIGRR